MTAGTVMVTAGGHVATTQTLSDDGITLTIVTAADVAAIGPARLAVTEGVADLAGNELVPATAAWTLPAWSRPAIGDRGASPGAPATGTCSGHIVPTWAGHSSPRGPHLGTPQV